MPKIDKQDKRKDPKSRTSGCMAVGLQEAEINYVTHQGSLRKFTVHEEMNVGYHCLYRPRKNYTVVLKFFNKVTENI